jgi:hypothetical protein
MRALPFLLLLACQDEGSAGADLDWPAADLDLQAAELPVTQAAPSANTLTLVGPTVVDKGAPAVWTVTGPTLDNGDEVLLAWGGSTAPQGGPCPWAGTIQPPLCVDVFGPARPVASATVSGGTATFPVVVPLTARSDVFLQAVSNDGAEAATSNVLAVELVRDLDGNDCDDAIVCLTFDGGSLANTGAAGGTLTAAGGPTLVTDPHGNLDGAYQFDGTNFLEQRIDLSFDADWTVTMWLRADSWPSWYRTPLALHSGNTSPGFNGGSRGMFFDVRDLGDTSVFFMPTDGAASGLPSSLRGDMGDLDDWVHLTYVRDGDLHRLYVDGVEVDETTLAFPTTSFVDGFVHVGAPNFYANDSNGDGYSWDTNGRGDAKWRGAIDDVRMFDHVLDEPRIAELAQRSAP